MVSVALFEIEVQAFLAVRPDTLASRHSKQLYCIWAYTPEDCTVTLLQRSLRFLNQTALWRMMLCNTECSTAGYGSCGCAPTAHRGTDMRTNVSGRFQQRGMFLAKTEVIACSCGVAVYENVGDRMWVVPCENGCN